MKGRRYHRSDRSALYCLFNSADELIYVGISYEPETRVQQHRVRQPWGSEIARHTVEWFEDRAASEAAESTLIRDERPRYNIAPGHAGYRAEPAPAEEEPGPLAEIAAAFKLIEQRDREYRAALRKHLDAGTVRQVDVAKALGLTRETIRRDALAG